MYNIIGYYKNYILVEKNGIYYVGKRDEKIVLYKGCEEVATKAFTMLLINYIDEHLEIEA